MGALDVKFGEILQQCRNLSESVDDLNQSTKLDHDVLILLKNTIEEDRKTFYRRIEELKEESRKGEEFRNNQIKLFLEAQEKRQAAIDAADRAAAMKREERVEKSVQSKRKVVYTVGMKILGWALTIVGAYLMARFGIGGKG